MLDPKRSREIYDDLRNKAHQIVKNGAAFDTSGKLIFCIYAIPTFHHATAWTVFYPRRKRDAVDVEAQNPIVSRIIWDNKCDWDRASKMILAPPNIEPTIIRDRLELNRDVFDEIMAQGRQITIPLVGLTAHIVVDGNSYGFVSDHPRYEIHWHAGEAPEFGRFERWVLEMGNFLDDTIQTAGSEFKG